MSPVSDTSMSSLSECPIPSESENGFPPSWVTERQNTIGGHPDNASSDPWKRDPTGGDCQLPSCAEAKLKLSAQVKFLTTRNADVESKLSAVDDAKWSAVCYVGKNKTILQAMNEAKHKIPALEAEVRSQHDENEVLRAINLELREKCDADEGLAAQVKAQTADKVTLRAQLQAQEADNMTIRTQAQAQETDNVSLRTEVGRLQQIIERCAHLREEKGKLDTIISSLEKQASGNPNGNIDEVQNEKDNFLAPLGRHYLKRAFEVL